MAERTEVWFAFRFARAEASVRLLRASLAASGDDRPAVVLALPCTAGPPVSASLAGAVVLRFQVRRPPPVLATLSVRVVELPCGKESVKLAGVTLITGALCTSKVLLKPV